MDRRRLTGRFRARLIPVPPRQYTGFEQSGWRSVVPVLRRGYYWIEKKTVSGDAPKDFVRVYEYGDGRRTEPDDWPAFIAKVGHKWYPAESITEQLMTRIGQTLGLRMASSRLMASEDQIRFMSRYFLTGDDSLVHGAEIVSGHLNDKDFVHTVETQKIESEVFTFQDLCAAIEFAFPGKREIINDFVRMLGFDAIIGNHDRHLYNWGVIAHPKGTTEPEFSPIYDTARGLLWNRSEAGLVKLQRPGKMLEYVTESRPQMGCDGHEKSVNHFQLIEGISLSDLKLQELLQGLVRDDTLTKIDDVLEHEFDRLLSAKRRTVIKQCLRLRFEKFVDATNGTYQC